MNMTVGVDKHMFSYGYIVADERMYYGKAKMLTYKSLRAFTIVELLIVIIIICILATIGIVTYGGIRQKANDTLIATTIESYAKAISLYRTTERKWPLQDSPSLTTACIGSEHSYEQEYGNLFFYMCNTLPYAERNHEFDEELSEYFADAPNLSFMEPLQYTPTNEYGRGIYYRVTCLPTSCSVSTTPTSDLDVSITYVIKSTKKCVIGDSIANTPTAGFTTCRHYIQHGKS